MLGGINIRLGPYRQLLFGILLLGLLCFYMGWTPFDRLNHKSTSLSSLLKASLVAAQKGGFQVKLAHDQNAMQVKSKGKTKEGANDPMTDADLKSHYAITQSLMDEFGKDSIQIISEEHNYEDLNKLQLSFDGFVPKEFSDLPTEDDLIDNDDIVVWVDPLDATQEFTEDLLNYVTVMICVAVKGSPVIGIVHKPFDGETYWAWVGKGKSSNLITPDKVYQKDLNAGMNLIVSRSHSGKVRETAQSAFGPTINIIAAGGAGYKVLEVTKGAADAYVHVTMIKKWDICAGNAILNSLGGNMTTLTGDKIKYGPQDGEKIEKGLLATIYNHDKYLKGLQNLQQNP